MLSVLNITLLLLILPAILNADESDVIKADRQALAEASAVGVSSKIIAAKEQLSDDLEKETDRKRQALEPKPQETQAKPQNAEDIVIPLTSDGQGHLLADVIINNTIHASLIVDTGAPDVVLSSAFVQRLGANFNKYNDGYVQVLGGKFKAAAVSLYSIQLGDIEVHNVNAVVLTEDSPGLQDGLLGLTFLSKFHATLDQTGRKLILRKLE